MIQNIIGGFKLAVLGRKFSEDAPNYTYRLGTERLHFFFTGPSESWGQGGISPPTNYGQIICITCSIKMPILLKIFRPSAGFVFIFFSPLYISAQVHLHWKRTLALNPYTMSWNPENSNFLRKSQKFDKIFQSLLCFWSILWKGPFY